MDQTEPFVHLGGLSKERNAEEGRKGNFLSKKKKKNRRNNILVNPLHLQKMSRFTISQQDTRVHLCFRCLIPPPRTTTTLTAWVAALTDGHQ